jgi:hypothetical protein
MNMIDRDAMWVQLFRMYHQGFVWEVLGQDIALLGLRNDKFIDYSLEYDLINKYLEPSQTPGIGVTELTAGAIKELIDKASNQKINLNKLGQELKRLGYVQIIKKIDGRTQRIYYVVERSRGLNLPGPTDNFPDADPF